MAQNVKSVCDVVIANVKTVCDAVIANVKTIAGVDDTAGGGGAVVEQFKTGTSSSATVAATWDTPATANRLLIIIVNADDYISAPNRPSGFTLSTGCGQEGFHGAYVFWKVAVGGESSVNYTIGSATVSVWITMEISGLTTSPYDVSAGQIANSGGASYTTPSITPTTGSRFLLAAMGASDGGSVSVTFSAWTNSFVETIEVSTPSGTARQSEGAATRSVTGDGVTTFSSGATYSDAAHDSHSGIIIGFKVT